MFEVLPSEVRAREPFLVRLHLFNQGRRAVRIRDVEVTIVEAGQKRTAPVAVLQEEVPSHDGALLTEYSGVWSSAGSWALEAVVMVHEDERVHSRLSFE